MKTVLPLEFTINKDEKTVNVKREFAASLELVWETWIKPEMLDQWWAPKPYRAETKTMDFREGGMWLYAMVSPSNERQWCKNEYHKIDWKKSFTALDTFCDENGTKDNNMPGTWWTNVFTSTGDRTLVSITAKYENLSDLEMIMEMGFQEGFTMALNNLDELLLNL